jgi:hypothetical protein
MKAGRQKDKQRDVPKKFTQYAQLCQVFHHCAISTLIANIMKICDRYFNPFSNCSPCKLKLDDFLIVYKKSNQK